jgi:energy-coupling factor transport system permease protein
MDQGAFFQRIGKRSTILIPLLANSLDRTIQVAEAMESRGFGQGSGRTFYRSIRFSPFDIFSLVVIAIPFIAAAVLCASGYGSYQYYPSLEPITINNSEILMTILLLLLLVVIVPLSVLKRRIDLD